MLTVRIETSGDAFADDPRWECARILRDIADRLESLDYGGKPRDVNGNTVGTFALTTED